MNRTRKSSQNRRGLLLLLVGVFATILTSDTDLPAAKPVVTAASQSTSAGSSARAQAPLSKQFADSNTQGVPDFQKHVMPLIGRLGCNGRACHGSFQGRGGFALSLFGYDFSADHKALLDEDSGRIDVDDPEESLALYKPTDADAHEGGKLFDEGEWRYNVLKRWIESGAKFDSSQVQTIEALEVTPSEIVFADGVSEIQLKVIARWPDGTSQDVTELSRFKSNDESVSSIDENGFVRSGMTGDTHLIVFYDNAVVSVPVIRPIEAQHSIGRSVPRSDHFIDQLVRHKLDKLNIEPSPLCSDADYIRRLTLDMTGLLPTPDRVREFLADKDPNKRTELVEELLDSDGYAAWWATRLSDWTGNSSEQLRNLLPTRGVANQLWYAWLRKRLEQNVPYDEIIEGIVAARSREPGESYRDYCENMSDCSRPGGDQKFANRSDMPLFWGRQNLKTKEESAIGFAYTFLGLRIECAQCHKHPFDTWSKDDFDQFANLFTPVQYSRNTVSPSSKSDHTVMMKEAFGDTKKKNNQLYKEANGIIREGGVVPFGELVVRARSYAPPKVTKKRKNKKKNKMQRRVPRGIILGEDDSIALNKDPRDELMEWLRSPENAYFAKAIVNRVWANYFGIGLVNPTDDLNLANPPANAELLESLANGLIENDFDLHWLHRSITTSDTYARSSITNASNEQDRTNFSHHVPHRLPAEVLYDAVTLATTSDAQASDLRKGLDKLAIANAKSPNRNRRDFAMQVFGQSIRESNCDCDRSDSPNLLQSVFLRNDNDIHSAIGSPNGWVHQICNELGVTPPKATATKSSRKASQIAALKKRLVVMAKAWQAAPKSGKPGRKKKQLKAFNALKGKLVSLGEQVPSIRILASDANPWSTQRKADSKSFRNAGEAAMASKQHNNLIDNAYLRILSRYPTQEEKQVSLDFVSSSKRVSDGYSSIVWALVNTKEFTLTH